MKNLLSLVVFLLLNPLFGADPVDLWSGREVVIPGSGRWELAARHGRLLGSGSGEARFTLPPLADGATLDAVLTQDGKAREVRFHSPKPLIGLAAGVRDLPPATAKRLQQYGLPAASPAPPEIWFCGIFPPNVAGRIVFVFPDKRDFPLPIGNVWDEVQLKRAKISGALGVLYNQKEQVLDLDGTFSYALLRQNQQTVVVFSPEFDFEKIENILQIKQLLLTPEKP